MIDPKFRISGICNLCQTLSLDTMIYSEYSLYLIENIKTEEDIYEFIVRKY